MIMILTVFGYLILLLLAWRRHRLEASPYEPGHLAGRPSMGVKGGFPARALWCKFSYDPQSFQGIRFRFILLFLFPLTVLPLPISGFPGWGEIKVKTRSQRGYFWPLPMPGAEQ